MEQNYAINTISLNQALPELVQKGFIAYCGAGISIAAPTCAPSWWTLTEEILTAFFDRIPKEYELPKDMIIKDKLFNPEGIFEVFGTVIGDHFFKTFSALDISTPNANHILIAKLAKSGILKACFTTNFDIYIERALQQEGVEYELIVENSEYNEIYEKLQQSPTTHKFLLCKIHGTIDRPKTIIALASAYKSSSGFSPTKGKVLQWLLTRYSCLFLGYSGWDFEHINYRKFWDRTGSTVENIYWNRRVGETGGPKFPMIFNSCLKKFVFSEADLPNDWVKALKTLNLNLVEGTGLSALTPEAEETQTQQLKQKREAFFRAWAHEIPETTALGTIIAEGVHFSAKFKQFRDDAINKAKGNSSQPQGPDPRLQQEMQVVAGKFQRQEITLPEYQAALQELQQEMMMFALTEDQKTSIKTMVKENLVPGITDNPAYSNAFVQKIIALIPRYPFDECKSIATEMQQKESASMMQGGNAYMAELTVNTWLCQNMDPTKNDWEPDYARIKDIQTQFIAGEIPDAQQFQAAMMSVAKDKQYRDMGFNIPIEAWIEKLVDLIANSQTQEEFIIGAEAFNTAIVGVYARINASLFETQEYKALQTAVNAKPSSPTIGQGTPGNQADLNARYMELATLLQEGTISQEEYVQQIQAIQQETMAKTTSPPPQDPVEVPESILTTYDELIRRPYTKAFDRLHELFPESGSYPEMLLELAVLSLWIAGSQMIYTEKSQQYYPIANRGDYPLIESHPSIVKYLYRQHAAWIDHGFSVFDDRYGHTLCRFAVELAEMAHDLDLCKKATDKALAFEEGHIDEKTFMKVPIALAAFYEQQNDAANALHYYELALEGLKSQFIPPFADIFVYKSAFLTMSHDKLKALKILLTGYPEYLGSEPPMKFPAREKGLALTTQLCAELGYDSPAAAIQALFAAKD